MFTTLPPYFHGPAPKRLTTALIEPVAESIDASKAFIRSEIVRAGELLKSVNFQPT